MSSINYQNSIKNIKKDIKKFGEETSIKELEKFLRYAMDMYHNDEQIITDNQYDKLMEYLETRDPKNKFINEIGAPVRDTMDKINLPFWMGGMEKIKGNEESKFMKYIARYNNGPFSISEKLDGISGLLVYEKGKKPLLATRGKDGMGQDISYLIPYLKLPKHNYDKIPKLAVRGELVVTKDKFNKKYKDKYPKGRSVVNAIINTKHPDSEILKDTDFVIYELVYPEEIEQTKQFKIIKELGYKLVNNKLFKENEFDFSLAPLTLLDMKKNSKYDIDGIILTHDKPYKRVKSGNPKHSIAFKLMLSEQIDKTTVVDVEWNPSKHGRLSPRIKFKPIKIGGDTINFTTGFHAKYIKEKKIGKGTQLKIVRSGDVIPYILEITIPSDKPLFPDSSIKYHWGNKKGESSVHIYLDDIDNNNEVIAKRLTNFFTTLKIAYLNIGLITRFINAGKTTLKSIYNMSVDDMMEIDGIQKTSANKYYKSIHDVLDNPIEGYLLMSASGKFGNGFGERKIKPILKKYPNVLKNYKKITVDDIMEIDGFAETTSEQFISNLPKFIKFLEENKFLKIKENTTKIQNIGNKFSGQQLVFSGFRDSKLEEYINNEGGKISNGVNSKTTMLVIKDKSTTGSKIQKAQDLNVPVMDLDSFKKKYKLQ